MTLLLPPRPLPQIMAPQPLVFGRWLTPPAGGPEQWLGRLGTRTSVAVTTPRLKPEPDARIWTAALLEAWTTGALVAMPFHQPGFLIGGPGAPVVDGSGQAGMTLNLRGLTPGYAIRHRQAFSLVHSGRRYLHFARALTQVGADGKVALPIMPMLRVSPANGAACEFRPVIEGKVAGDGAGWTHRIARVDGLSFTIAEIA